MWKLETRDPQTIVKHKILANYAKRWASIIVQGLKKTYQRQSAQSAFSVNFTYVDCFAHSGRFLDPRDPRGWTEGSPLIGIKALDAIQEFAVKNIGFKPNVRVALFEIETDIYQALLDSLEIAGFSHRVVVSQDVSTLLPSQIAVINDDYRNHLSNLEGLLSRPYTWTLLFVDPYGPRSMELDVVGRLVALPRTDVIINFPYQDLHKKTGSARRGTPEHKMHLQYYDALYGDETWRDIANRLGNQPDVMETTLVQEYARRLQLKDADLTVKSIPLRFPDKERTMFYLFLTTHDPTGALAINEVLYEAKQGEHVYRVEWKTEQNRERIIQASGGLDQLSLPFLDAVDESAAETTKAARPPIEQIADDIFTKCRGETLEFKQVVRRLVDSDYFPEEVKSAIRHLRKNKLASFTGDLRANTTIAFVR